MALNTPNMCSEIATKKFVELVPVTSALCDGVDCFVVCDSSIFDPMKLIKIVFVRNEKMDFTVFAAMVALLFGFGWPSVITPKLLSSIKHYRSEWHDIYRMYLLGSTLDDIYKAYEENGMFDGISEKDVKTFKVDTEKYLPLFISEAVNSPSVQNVAEQLAEQTAIFFEIFPHLLRSTKRKNAALNNAFSFSRVPGYT